MQQYTVPILLVVFKRPDTTEQIFEVLRKKRPCKLFIASDHYRENIGGEKELCERVKQIVQNVDWDCEVKYNFAEHNMGCDDRMVSAINWFFDHVEQGIILEDDCLPGDSFFTFSEKMLSFYENNETIMHISGNNFHFDRRVFEYPYYVSKYNHSWGWATWRRAWKKFDNNLTTFSEFAKKGLINTVSERDKEKKYWMNFFDRIYNGKYTFWDTKWLYSMWYNGGLAIIPAKNLVSNIGFGLEATHTKDVNKFAGLRIDNLDIEKYMSHVSVDREADDYIFKTLYWQSFVARVLARLKKYI